MDLKKKSHLSHMLLQILLSDRVGIKVNVQRNQMLNKEKFVLVDCCLVDCLLFLKGKSFQSFVRNVVNFIMRLSLIHI